MEKGTIEGDNEGTQGRGSSGRRISLNSWRSHGMTALKACGGYGSYEGHKGCEGCEGYEGYDDASYEGYEGHEGYPES